MFFLNAAYFLLNFYLWIFVYTFTEMERIDKDLIIEFYTYFYKKRFNSPKYIYKPSPKGLKVIDSFLKLIDKKISLKLVSREFLWNYFIYQFNHWRDSELNAVYGKFRIELIIGKKAFERFILDEKDLMWVTQHSDIINKYKFNKSDLVKIEITKSTYNPDIEIPIKKKFYNTNKGFYICITTTTMFNHSHTCCLFCNFKEDCKKVLKSNYPKIYDKRGY